MYLLDSNDLINSPADRGATAVLYPSGESPASPRRLFLESGDWQVLEELGLNVEVCHLNEGHAAFAVLARAYSFMCLTKQPFRVAFWATKAGNTFTTHTPVEAAFDRFPFDLIRPYATYLAELMHVPVHDLLVLGRMDRDNRICPHLRH